MELVEPTGASGPTGPILSQHQPELAPLAPGCNIMTRSSLSGYQGSPLLMVKTLSKKIMNSGLFQIRVFSRFGFLDSGLFQIRGFQIRGFQIWGVQIWGFQIRGFQIQGFQIKTLPHFKGLMKPDRSTTQVKKFP